MVQDRRLQELTELRLALAVLSVQLEALAAKRSCSFAVPADVANPKIDQSFALRAVLAMRHAN